MTAIPTQDPDKVVAGLIDPVLTELTDDLRGIRTLGTGERRVPHDGLAGAFASGSWAGSAPWSSSS